MRSKEEEEVEGCVGDGCGDAMEERRCWSVHSGWLGRRTINDQRSTINDQRNLSPLRLHRKTVVSCITATAVEQTATCRQRARYHFKTHKITMPAQTLSPRAYALPERVRNDPNEAREAVLCIPFGKHSGLKLPSAARTLLKDVFDT